MKLEQQTVAILVGAALVSATVSMGTCSTNARNDDMRSTHEDIRSEMRDGFGRIDERIDGIDERLRAVETAVAVIKEWVEEQ